ncbi:MAG: ubiquinone/menaquinone biosynthesis C-methylase UbiE [Bacteroidia bacterium]|jgi:ubiquinone/menaquinone biosynthesis C-methylase UbiE
MDLVEARAENANRHPWELSRAASSLKILGQMPKGLKFADVGAGDIYFATRLAEQLDDDVLAIDIGYERTETVGRVHKYINISELEDNSVDVVLLMDVIEHINDVGAFLSELMPKVKSGGYFYITVPAFQFLFSEHDVFLRHYRRYSKKLMRTTMASQPLTIEKMFYFYTSLFAARTLVKGIETIMPPNKSGEGVGNWGEDENHWKTKMVEGVLNVDFKVNHALQKLGLNLPGLSLCALCKKE